MEVSQFIALLPIALLSLPVLLFFFSTGRKTSPPHVDGRSLPPSPPGLPLLGHLPLLGSLPHRKLRAMAGTHGPVMLLRLGCVPTVVVSSAAAAQEAMKTRDPAFASRFRSRVVERLFYGRDMAFADYGDHWRQARRVCVLHLLSQRRVLSFRRLREREVATLVDRVRGGAATAVNMSELLISYAKDVIVHAALGGDYGFVGGGKVRKVFTDLGELLDSGTVGELVPWLAWVDSVRGLDAKVTRTIKMLDGLLEHAIADHRERRRVGRQRMGGGDEDDQRDFVDALLDASEEEEAGELWFDTVATIKAIILDMFIAATDTTYTTLEWAMAELSNHPDKMRRLQDEIRASVGDEDHVTEDRLNMLPYLKSVIKETLRLHPPVPLVPRETIEDTELLGYHIPAGTHILINVWTVGRDPATWERAEEFLPERFAEDATMDQYLLGHDVTLFPFGAGRRGCPGVGFSMKSLELVLASLLYHFDWELPNGASAVDMNEQGGLSVRLKKTLHLIAKPWSTVERTMCPEL